MNNADFIKRIQKIEHEILDDIVKVCDDANISYFLDGGTLLGAKRHKGFIPWDDDIDIGIYKDDWNDFESLIVDKLSDKYIIQSERGSVKIDPLRVHLKVNYRNSYVLDVSTDTYKNYPMSDQNIFVDVFRFSPMPESNEFTLLIWAILFWTATFKESRIHKLKELISQRYSNKFLSKIFGLLYPFLYVFFLFVGLFEEKILDYYNRRAKDSSSIGFDISHWRNMKPVRIPKDLVYPVCKNSVEFEGKMYSAPNWAIEYLELRYGDWKKLPKVEDRTFQHFTYIDFEDENILDKNSELKP